MSVSNTSTSTPLTPSISSVSVPGSHAPTAPGNPASNRVEEFRQLCVLAEATFLRELPELLAKHPGEWIVYRGDVRLGIGRTRTELHRQCVRAGLDVDEFLVCHIHPQLDVIEMGVELAD